MNFGPLCSEKDAPLLVWFLTSIDQRVLCVDVQVYLKSILHHRGLEFCCCLFKSLHNDLIPRMVTRI